MDGPVSDQEWGRASLKICDALTVPEQAARPGIGAFYRANKANTMLAIGRAVEGNSGVRVRGVEEDSPLVQVIFYSQLGYQYFNSILKGHFLQACLQAELKEISYDEPIIISVEKWELPNLPEGEVDSWELVSMGTRGIMLDKVMLWLDNFPDISDEEHAEEEEEDVAGPSRAKHARRQEQPPAEITAQQSELQEGPLKRQRSRLLQHKDSPTAHTFLKAYSCLEKGAAMVTSGCPEGEDVEHLLEGLILMERVSPDDVNTVLHDQSWLNLDKLQLDKLISAQLQAKPDSTPCLLLQALQLSESHSRQQAINHVLDVVLQHGETDPMYQHLAYMYYALGRTILIATRQPAPALSACASALMYKSDLLSTLFYTAGCSSNVSVPQAIRQFHHYIHTAPTDHRWVPNAHYLLVTLYGQQDPSVHRDRILHHYNMAQQADRNRLPVFPPVPSGITDPARKVYELVMV